MTLSSNVDDTIRGAGVPILGVSCPSNDKATWRVDFKPEATQAQRDQAAQIIAAYTLPTPNTLLDREASGAFLDKKTRALLQALYECIPAPTMTKAQALKRAIDIYKTL